MWHGTFIRAVGSFPLKNCTLSHAELFVYSDTVESVKPPHLCGLPTIIISADAAPLVSISSIVACVTNELGDPLSRRATDLYFFFSFSAAMNAYSHSEARMIHRNITSGTIWTIFMKIAGIFHRTHSLIGIYLSFEVASFFRVLSVLLLVIFIRAVTSHRYEDSHKEYFFQSWDRSLFQLLYHSFLVP